MMSGMASAGMITANATIDLDTAITGDTWTGYAHMLDSEVTVASGDTVTINIDFLGDQYLTWGSEGRFDPWLMINDWWDSWNYENPDDTGFFSWSNTDVEFHNLIQGTNFAQSQLDSSGSSGNIHLGPTAVLGFDNVVRQFSGVSVTFDVLFTDGDEFRTYDSLGYVPTQVLFAGTVSSSVIASVSEPSALSLLSLAVLGLAYRKRSSKV